MKFTETFFVDYNFRFRAVVPDYCRSGSMQKSLQTFCQKCSCDIPNFLLPDDWETTSWARQNVFHVKLASQTQLMGIFKGVYPYLNARAST